MILKFLTWIANRHLRTKSGDRVPCPLCCLKHIGQARALMLEARKGYPNSFWFSLGHLAEAEDEILSTSKDLAALIREERKTLERNPGYQIDFDELVEVISITASLDPTKFLKGNTL
jgi:hypothetical protein